MKRWLFNIAAAGSLLIAILVVFLWIRSEFVLEYVRYRRLPSRTEYLELTIGTLPGAIKIQYERTFSTSNDSGNGLSIPERLRALGLTAPGYGFIARSQSPLPEQLWFIWEKEGPTASPGAKTALDRLQIPDWFPLMLSLILPTMWIIKIRRRGKLPGCCSKCGYDLRHAPAVSRMRDGSFDIIKDRISHRYAPMNTDFEISNLECIRVHRCPSVAKLYVKLA